MPEYEGKYIFVSNTRTTSAGVVPAMFVYTRQERQKSNITMKSLMLCSLMMSFLRITKL